MAKRKKTVKKQHTPFLLRYLPESVQAFIARRIMDAGAALFALGGIYSFIALTTYSPHDPSLNVVTGSDETSNLTGRGGAIWADLLIQTFGFASFLLPVTLLAWAGCLCVRRPLRPLSLRIPALIFALFAATIVFSRIPAPIDWPYAWAGGPIGTALVDMMIGGVSFPLILVLACVTGITAFAYAVTAGLSEIIFMLNHAKGAIITASVNMYIFTKTFVAWLKHYNDPAWKASQAQQKTRLKTARKTKTVQKNTIPATPEEHKEPPRPAPHISVSTPQKTEKTTQQRLKIADSEGLGNEDWELPSLDLMQDIPEQDNVDLLDKDQLRQNAELLQQVLADFNIQGDITAIHPGPVVTLYELEPAPGTKTARVISLADDIARSMSAVSVRAAVVPGQNVIGIELPNDRRQTVYLRELLASREVEKTKAALPLILGKDIGGKPIIGDLAKMPHLLVAGTTGSGKSVAVNTMILSLLYRLPPDKCRFIMIDPKMLELSVYDDIPHLLSPVVTEPGKAVVSLKWTVAEMEERYRAMSKLGVRNIEGYNQRVREARKKGEVLMRKVQTGFDHETGKPVYEEQPLDLTELPYIVVIVDEFADLMLVAGKDVENAIQRLAQMARAAGIHLIMATQRPSVDVITGVIKANFPTRISFAVTSKIDSRTILGEGGAEQLLGMGDMLYMAGGGRISRVHGPFVSDDDVENVVNFLKNQSEPNYIGTITEGGDFGDNEVMSALFGDGEGGGDQVDELYDEAVAIIAREGKASTSFIQRHLQIGYNRAARIIEEMERQGVVSPATRTGKREVLVSDQSGYADTGS